MFEDFEFSLKGILKVVAPLINAAAILVLGVFFIWLLTKFVGKGMEKAKLDVSLIKFIKKVIKITCYVIIFIAMLSSLGISTTGIIAAFSAAGVAVALALCEHALQGRGAYRVHGGGFAGTVQAFVPFDMLEQFKTQIDTALGEGACHVLSIRPEGGVPME